jgi:curved DNA-binding protein CbpA
MATLLDRLLEVAKDFEAERLTEQLEHQKRARGLEQDLKSMARTAQYRADEITFLEQQLAEARADAETAALALREERAAAAAAKEAAEVERERGSAEQRMRREIVCLRFEVARLRARGERLTRKLTGAGKENTNAEVAAREIAAEVAAMALEDAEESFVPLPAAGAATAALGAGGAGASSSSSDFLRAAERGDAHAIESILSPDCVCDAVYERAVTSALSRVCAAAATTSATAAAATAAAASSGEGDAASVVDAGISALSRQRLHIAKLLIAEGAATTAATPTAPSALHLAAWSGDAGLVELLLAQPTPPVNTSCKGKGSLSGTPLELAIASGRGDPAAVTKSLLMSGADPTLSTIVTALADEASAAAGGAAAGGAVDDAASSGGKDEGQHSTTVGAGGGESADPELLGAVPGGGNDILASKKIMRGSKSSKAHKTTSSTKSKRASAPVRNVFQDCSVMFWNSSVRAYEAYSSSSYDKALTIWGDALEFIAKGKLSISGADKARLHYNRARAMCHLKRRVDALEELEKALTLSPDYVNARTLQAESYFELYAFDKCLAAMAVLEEAGAVDDKPKLVAIRNKAREQKNLNHYQVLGIASEASESEIKKAYRRQSMKWHPDKHQQSTDSKAQANTTFKRLNEANQVLGESYSKMMYDAELEVQKRQEFAELRRKKQQAEDDEAYERRRQRRRRAADSGGTSGGAGDSAGMPDARSVAARYLQQQYQKANYSDGARRGYGRVDVMSDEDEDEDEHEEYGFEERRGSYSSRDGGRSDVRWPDRSKGQMLDSFDGDDAFGEEELMHDSFDGGGFEYGPGYR